VESGEDLKIMTRTNSWGDLVKLKDPYQRCYSYGVVVEIVSRTRHKLPRNVSLHFYDDDGQL
jgi:hypothetical protein